MRSRRRPTPISSAAALPASRLPLGTPHLPTSTSHESTASSSHSPPRLKPQVTDSSSDKENWNVHDTFSLTRSKDTLIMAPNISLEDALARSIAETKLERQNKRIQETEAALITIAPPDKRTHQPRGKKNKWQPLDLTDHALATTPNDGGVFVSEVRVNTFRAPSRGSSLSRPVSVLSHRTSETAPSDMDRQDSALTDQGFQVFQRRKTKRPLGDLHAYEHKPEDRQTTVEAAVDIHEIHNVFGIALPGPEVIVAKEGTVDGEVRFTQHPNGDVLAHQWSSDRYLWDNIGQFSNHRKRTEGQLKADRLRGETAYQSLQCHSLAYFRLIAKQREANAIGKPLSLKEIQSALPEPQVESSAAPPGLKEVARGRSSPLWKSNIIKPQYIPPQLGVTSEAGLAKPQQSMAWQHRVPAEPRTEPYRLTPKYVPHELRHEDPFYTANSFKQIYGDQSYSHPYQQNSIAQTQPMPTTQQPRNVQTNFYFQKVATAHPNIHIGDVASPFPEVENFTMQGIEHWQQQQMRGSRLATTASQTRTQYHTTGTIVSSSSSDMITRPIPMLTMTDASKPKPVTPFDDRSAMRDNLWKQADAAKERNLSQGSILSRTVLYDPLQNQSPSVKTETENEPMKHEMSPSLDRGAPRKILRPASSIEPSSSRVFPMPVLPAPTPQSTKQTSPVSTVLQNLHDSSPDPYPTKQSYTYQPPIINTPSDLQGTPQNFKGPFFPADSGVSTASIDQKTYDEQLKEWWTSGQKFARQEEFYRSITSSAARQPAKGPLANLPAHLTPIGHPARTKAQEPEFDATTTRLLIPVLENLASYVQGPIEKRRDYFSQWKQPPEWCIDRSEGGNNSFFDKNWGTPPARVGRDPRYARSPWVDDRTPLRGRYGSGGVSLGGSFGGGGYVDRRFGFGGSYYG